MKSEIDYEKDVSINEDALDIEWLIQPKLMLKYTQHEAEMKRNLEEAKSNLDILHADLDKKIRTEPEKFGLDKITETAIKNAIQSTTKFKEAQEEIREAEYEVNMAVAAVRSIYGKKEALENLVRLFGQQYFAGPSVPRDLSEEWKKEQKQKESNKKVKMGKSKKIKRRRNK